MNAEDKFAIAKWRYLQGLISEAEFLKAHRAMIEEKENGNL